VRSIEIDSNRSTAVVTDDFSAKETYRRTKTRFLARKLRESATQRNAEQQAERSEKRKRKPFLLKLSSLQSTTGTCNPPPVWPCITNTSHSNREDDTDSCLNAVGCMEAVTVEWRMAFERFGCRGFQDWSHDLIENTWTSRRLDKQWRKKTTLERNENEHDGQCHFVEWKNEKDKDDTRCPSIHRMNRGFH
jgi:hypothetical protein